MFAGSACGPRAAGPDESEFGKTFFWRVSEDVELNFEGCTDLESFRDDIEAPSVEENSFVIYKINAEGSEAISQDCETLATESCSDDEALYTRDENTFEAVVDLPLLDFAGGCEGARRQVLRLIDEGETLSFSLQLELSLESPEQACSLLERQIREESPNGLGLDGCVVSLTTNAQFERALD